MTRFMLQFGLIAALLALPAAAQAQGSPVGRGGTASDQKACNGDARRHCRHLLEQPDMIVLACLKQHRSQLTRACQAVLQKHGQ
jgi:hypothetical protein